MATTPKTTAGTLTGGKPSARYLPSLLAYGRPRHPTGPGFSTELKKCTARAQQSKPPMYALSREPHITPAAAAPGTVESSFRTNFVVPPVYLQPHFEAKQRAAQPSPVPPGAALARLGSPTHGPKVLTRRGQTVVISQENTRIWPYQDADPRKDRRTRGPFIRYSISKVAMK
jgi:hypothetical protein